MTKMESAAKTMIDWIEKVAIGEFDAEPVQASQHAKDIMKEPPFKNLKAALDPSREEIADWLENSLYADDMIKHAIGELRND